MIKKQNSCSWLYWAFSIRSSQAAATTTPLCASFPESISTTVQTKVQLYMQLQRGTTTAWLVHTELFLHFKLHIFSCMKLWTPCPLPFHAHLDHRPPLILLSSSFSPARSTSHYSSSIQVLCPRRGDGGCNITSYQPCNNSLLHPLRSVNLLLFSTSATLFVLLQPQHCDFLPSWKIEDILVRE